MKNCLVCGSLMSDSRSGNQVVSGRSSCRNGCTTLVLGDIGYIQEIYSADGTGNSMSRTIFYNETLADRLSHYRAIAEFAIRVRQATGRRFILEEEQNLAQSLAQMFLGV